MTNGASAGDDTEATDAASDADSDFEVPEKSALSVCEYGWKPAATTCYDFEDLVLIELCDENAREAKTYRLPRGLLQWHSSGDGKLSLEERIDVFDIFVNWLWTGRLKAELPAGMTADADNMYITELQSCEVWIFSDMRGIPALCNAAVDMLHERAAAEHTFPSSIVQDVYERTAPDTALRSFRQDICVASYTSTELTTDFAPEQFTVQFLFDVMPKLASKRWDRKILSQEEWVTINRCTWHNHSGPGGKLRLESRT